MMQPRRNHAIRCARTVQLHHDQIEFPNPPAGDGRPRLQEGPCDNYDQKSSRRTNRSRKYARPDGDFFSAQASGVSLAIDSFVVMQYQQACAFKGRDHTQDAPAVFGVALHLYALGRI